jgi:hypothetical protein
LTVNYFARAKSTIQDSGVQALSALGNIKKGSEDNAFEPFLQK